MTLEDAAHSVETKEDFVAFLEALQADYEANGASWENGTLSLFLQAAAAWSNDMEGYYRNIGQDATSSSPWRVFTDILMAARVYE